ncbi:MAG: cell envelope integrity protein CreD [Pseudomonadota bacterium]
MQQLTQRLRASTTLKVFSIGVLILVLLIPMSMIESVIYERQSMGHVAERNIQQTWGMQQLVAGPVLVIPYKVYWTDADGDERSRDKILYRLPKTLDIDADVRTERRYRGKHVVPVYTSTVTLAGALPSIEQLGLTPEHIVWEEAYVAIGISDGRAIAETPSMRINGNDVAFVPGGQRIDYLPPQIIAPLSSVADAIKTDQDIAFSIELHVKGSEMLRFLPFGDTTTVRMTADWDSPSFVGNYLPIERDISESGFTAEWKVSSIGRPLPAEWGERSDPTRNAEQSAFGVTLYTPISIYRLTERAAKYGVLFIGLTFVAYFMFEITGGLRLHPLQYLMVGMANALFYLLLISFAEHIGFGIAYLLSVIASSALIVGYSQAVLGTGRRSMVMGGILLLLYSFLYMTLKAEDYALLAGSIGLWLTLALVMYLTRRIDWYGRGTTDGAENNSVSS